MTDQNIELEPTKDSSLLAILGRAAELGVDLDTAQLMMGYTRRSTPLLGDIRVAAVVATDAAGHAAELVHMPLDNLDPVTLDEEIITQVLVENFDIEPIHHAHSVAHLIVAAIRGTTTPKES